MGNGFGGCGGRGSWWIILIIIIILLLIPGFGFDDTTLQSAKHIPLTLSAFYYYKAGTHTPRTCQATNSKTSYGGKKMTAIGGFVIAGAHIVVRKLS